MSKNPPAWFNRPNAKQKKHARIVPQQEPGEKKRFPPPPPPIVEPTPKRYVLAFCTVHGESAHKKMPDGEPGHCLRCAFGRNTETA